MTLKNEDLCDTLLRDDKRSRKRLTEVLAGIDVLQQHRKLLLELQKLDASSKESCPGLAAATAERAVEAEAAARVMTMHALDAINELRDSGALDPMLQRVGRQFTDLKTSDLLDHLESEGKRAKEAFGDAAGVMFTEAVAAVKGMDLGVGFQEDRILLTRKGPPGGADKFEIATSRRPGQLGRISSQEFFKGPGRLAVLSSGRTFLPHDCHHRPRSVVAEQASVIDAYSGVLTGLSAMKSMLYQHVRRVTELGPRGMRGNDPLTIVLGVIAAVGVGLLIYGLVTGDEFFVVFGAVLIIGAVLVFCCGFVLVLAVIA